MRLVGFPGQSANGEPETIRVTTYAKPDSLQPQPAFPNSGFAERDRFDIPWNAMMAAAVRSMRCRPLRSCLRRVSLC